MDTAARVLKPVATVQAATGLKRELGLRDLTLFSITCITAARWIPFAAHAGPVSITLWLLAGILFVAPLADTVAALVVKYPGVGGLYLWTREDFGPWNGFLCFWLYWVGIAFLFPAAAITHVKVGFSLLGPSYARWGDSRICILAATLALIWIAMGSNLIGMNIGKWTENLGGAATWSLAVVLVVAALGAWVKRGSATAFHVVPTWDWNTVNLWAAIAYATSGLESAGMMAGEIHDPERTIRRAGWTASAVAMAFYIAATAAFLIILPPQQVSELSGFADVGQAAGQLLSAMWLAPLIAVLFVLSGLGLVGGIGTATSRLPFAAGVDGLLPKAFGKVHPRWGTPYVATLALGGLASLLLVLYQLGDSLRAAFDELVSMMVITGFIPFLYIFGSAWRAGRRVSAISGLTVTGLALICSVVPPAEVTNVWLFEGKLLAGTSIVILLGWVLYRQNRGRAQAAAVVCRDEVRSAGRAE